MADRDPDDTAPTPLQEAPAPLRASTTDVAEFLEIVNQVAIVWAEIYPQGSATPREFAGHFNKTYEALRNVPSNLRGRVIFLPELGLPPGTMDSTDKDSVSHLPRSCPFGSVGSA